MSQSEEVRKMLEMALEWADGGNLDLSLVPFNAARTESQFGKALAAEARRIEAERDALRRKINKYEVLLKENSEAEIGGKKSLSGELVTDPRTLEYMCCLKQLNTIEAERDSLRKELDEARATSAQKNETPDQIFTRHEKDRLYYESLGSEGYPTGPCRCATCIWLSRHDAEVAAKAKSIALRHAANWFNSWKEMPASYERSGEALNRMADEYDKEEIKAAALQKGQEKKQ